jgi:diacylglycerol kinase (ATP)
MPGIGIILNPYSSLYRNDPERLKRVGFIVGDRGSCHATDTLDDVRELASEFKERDIDILGISGGDGTNHKTLTAFIKVYGEKPLPRIAFLRGGTANNTATQLGIRGTPERILSNLMFKYHESQPFKEARIHMIRVNGEYGFIYGVGAPERFISRYLEVAEYGKFRAACILLRGMFSALFNGRFARMLCKRFDCKLLIDGRPVPIKNCVAMVAGSGRSLGFNFRTLYRATSDPGRFQIVAVSATPRQFLATFPRMLLAKPTKSKHVIDEMASSAAFEFDRPMPYVVDGEILGPTDRIEIATGPLLTCIVS